MSQPLLFENHPNDSRIKLCEGRSNALNARMGTGGGNVGIVLWKTNGLH